MELEGLRRHQGKSPAAAVRASLRVPLMGQLERGLKWEREEGKDVPVLSGAVG